MFHVESITTVSEEPERTNLDRIEANADKGNFISSKREKTFMRNRFVICEFISQCYIYVSWSSALTLSLRNLRRATSEHIYNYADKGNIIRSKRERSLLRNFFLICEFISQTYNLDFRKQFANTLFVDSGK